MGTLIVIAGVALIFFGVCFACYKISFILSELPESSYSITEEKKYNIKPIYEESVE
jgi:hypothetical protein